MSRLPKRILAWEDGQERYWAPADSIEDLTEVMTDESGLYKRIDQARPERFARAAALLLAGVVLGVVMGGYG